VTWFDAIAPFHPTAVGIYTQVTNRFTETTNKGKNIALLYSTYHLLILLAPPLKQNWAGMLLAAGLDPNLDSSDVTTP